MGGNAIKGARRVPRSEYFELVDELQALFPELKMKAVQAFRTKPDFGDIDIVVESSPHRDIPQLVKTRLNPPNVSHNNMFFSFEHRGVQVDFISMSPEDFIPAFSYFCWNDLGNFIGRTARTIDFKYGHDGLAYELRLGDHYKKSIIVSRDTDKILEFLGYDPLVWRAGFNTEEEIFAYAASSKLFNSSYFTLEEQSHNDRVRNKKRKMYQKMLAYIQANGIEDKPRLSKEERYALGIERADSFFDTGCGLSLKTDIKEATDAFNLDIEYKSYFNGDIVGKITGFTGKKLGRFMRTINFYTTDLKERVLQEDKEDRDTFVLDIVYDILAGFSTHEPTEDPGLTADDALWARGTHYGSDKFMELFRKNGEFYLTLNSGGEASKILGTYRLDFKDA